jgi:predicted deacetylase
MKKLIKFGIVILGILITLFVIRLFSERQLDDVNPLISCEEELIQKSDILYVIPKFEGVGISSNPEWCTKILAYNKTLGLHGVYHTYQEFKTERNQSYLAEGEEEFYNCFGFYPTRFKAPQVTMSLGNERMLIERGYKLDTLLTDSIHKVYHCNNQGFYDNYVSDWL